MAADTREDGAEDLAAQAAALSGGGGRHVAFSLEVLSHVSIEKIIPNWKEGVRSGEIDISSRASHARTAEDARAPGRLTRV